MRVLHLIDGAAPGETWTPGRAGEVELEACALAMRLVPDVAHAVCLVGGSWLERTAADLGVLTTDRIAPPLGRAGMAARALRRLVRDRGMPDIVHAWSPASMRLALAAFPGGVGVVGWSALPPAGGHRADVRRLRGLSVLHGSRAADVVLFADSRWPERSPTERGPHLASAPPAAVRWLTPEERARGRAALGLGESDVLIAPVGLPGQVDAVRFAFLLGLLAQADVRVIGLLPRQAGQAWRGLRYARQLPARSRLLVARRPMTRLLGLCDLGVWDGGGFGPVSSPPFVPGSGTLPIASAHGAGVPVVSPAGACSELLYPGASREACLGHSAALPELARKLIPLAADAARRRDAGEAVRAVIERERSDRLFAAACLGAYREAGRTAPAGPMGRAGAVVALGV